MREPVRDRDRLEHILEAIDTILTYAEGKKINELQADKLRYYGIVKNIEIIGEATYKLTHAFCQLHPQTPWDFIAKMRHVLVHDYYQIDTEQVWNVIQEDLPLLREQITTYLIETNWDEWANNSAVVSESVMHKSLLQTALRMKKDGLSNEKISHYTGLSIEEIGEL